MPNPATNTYNADKWLVRYRLRATSARTMRIPMHVPKPLLAVSLAVLSIAVTLGCFAQVF
ncbi:hypothetical protein SAMN02787118_1547 [Streptomyces mirabilis]|uniref:Uncharacterized protein n=2 Tax=Streptomyces mirabilis TaxID=68239 RepID=A0A1I2XY22_9ACTN|nr:hypothetical protein SAMN02787118_1547 [Streptomyces mirabilis]